MCVVDDDSWVTRHLRYLFYTQTPRDVLKGCTGQFLP